MTLVRAAGYKRYSVVDNLPKKGVLSVFDRKFRRSILNINEMVIILQDKGIEIRNITFNDIPFSEQVRIFSETSTLFSIHGAHLINIIFMHPYTSVVEVFNPYFYFDCYKRIAAAAQINHIAINNTIIEPSSIERSKNAWQPYINVDVNLNLTTTIPIVLDAIH